MVGLAVEIEKSKRNSKTGRDFLMVSSQQSVVHQVGIGLGCILNQYITTLKNNAKPCFRQCILTPDEAWVEPCLLAMTLEQVVAFEVLVEFF
jgi:hypothetical protein